MKKSKNVFISHYGKEDDKVQRLKERFAEKGYNIRNYSVDSTKHTRKKRPSDELIKRFLRRQISWSSSLICMIGPKTHTRDWVNYEIEAAHKQGKKIVGIYTHGNNDSVQLPTAFKKYGGSTIGWNSIDKLMDIMNDKKFPMESGQGTPRTPMYSVSDSNC
ncbi:MAG: TIR domain-containing protein [Maribacter stanieri]